MTNFYSKETNFYGNTNPKELLEKYSSPLYVYNEDILRQKCRDMHNLVQGKVKFVANYSTKANSNLELLKIINSEGLHADAMSPGEIFILEKAGFTSDRIFYVSNNVNVEEMRFAVDRGIRISIDSISQLETYGQNFPDTEIAVRFNTGVSAGHHAKVVTGGKKTKFAINIDLIDEVKEITKKYNLRVAGINQHIGSLFMDGKVYLEGVKMLLETARNFEKLDYIDFGGGFGIPYNKQEGEKPLEIKKFGAAFGDLLAEFEKDYNPGMTFKIEPGRYIVAESCILLGTVHSIKQNYSKTFVGTDLGFNVLIRPTMYDSHHDLEIYRNGKLLEGKNTETVTITGNICESGDLIAKNRTLQRIRLNDIIGCMDAGAYGYSMSSNYNNRLRPAEVILTSDGTSKIIRRKETLDDLLALF